MSMNGFGRASGPLIPPKLLTNHFPNFVRPPSPSPVSSPTPQSPPPSFSSSAVQRSPRKNEFYPNLDNEQKSFSKDDGAHPNNRPLEVTSFVASHNSGTNIIAKIAPFQDMKGNKSPPLPFTGEDSWRNSSQSAINSRSAFPVNKRNHLVWQRTQSPPSLKNSHSVENHSTPFGEVKRSDFLLNDRSYLGPQQTQSPPAAYEKKHHVEDFHNFGEAQRPSISPPRFRTRSNVFAHASDSQIIQRSIPSARNIDTEAAETKPTSFPVPKRTRSPPLPSADQVLQGNFYTSQDDTERERQAKAKRLARFKVELTENVQSGSDAAGQNFSANRLDQSMAVRGNFVGGQSMEAAGEGTNGTGLPDEGLDSSRIIVGSCPDMCPESERAERERKGDLDQYERLDGNRNQTSRSLAVKKYNRTADREACLIRPMPILKKTIDYLLNLLDQPYDDRFLGMYNFLWDRMRAVRMDLRMQHIFNHGAISMLEQMIRLHIIAMHELCGYAKGEGFSEGFDAHLNIEQMNKTSVELFQMYDDHRKKGINVPTEKEFRGYYALLKLDKHPGYKVEPAELSLDLAKMTPEIRQTPEVLFARDVARACRTGNFIAFFRLARKASYLQACLMHAHFAKLRTQALASLHCGLQNNQGLPVSHVSTWLGMEEEDIESLLEYHGFLIKEFEEPYMVKEGPFLNGDSDYPTKCSNLVQLKKSSTIVEDVNYTCQAVLISVKELKETQQGEVRMNDPESVESDEKASTANAINDEMSDFEDFSSVNGTKFQLLVETSPVVEQSLDDHEVVPASISHSPWAFSSALNYPVSQPTKFKTVEKPNNDVLFTNILERSIHNGIEERLQSASSTPQPDLSPRLQFNNVLDSPITLGMVTDKPIDEEPPYTHQEIENDEAMENGEDEKVGEAKLKLIIRLWKRRATKQRELREQRQLAANAALNSLSLGPPIRQHKDQLRTLAEFDIDHVMKQRDEKRERSWSRLNVSDVIAGVLNRRNPHAKCLCWKIVVCSHMNNLKSDNLFQNCQATNMEAGPWLLSKLMPTRKDIDDDLVISSPGLSIWKKWIPSQFGADLACCLSVVKDTSFDNLNEAVSGASAVIFLICERIPWELQKIQLHNLVMSLPSDSRLPLLILCGSYSEDLSHCSSAIINKLGLHDIEKSRVSNFMIVFLVGDNPMEHDGFFMDERLREGLQWLASESPLHPVLHCVKTRDLVLTHLNTSLELLDKMTANEVHPDHCISAFNASLDQSVAEIATAANRNAACWPCPEITMLEELSDEYLVVNPYLPKVGWSSATRIQPIISALNGCKLPMCSDATSWLSRSSNSGKEIEKQRLQLENFLIRYLTHLSNMMGYELATKEARVMVQKSARLELHDSKFYIIPKWVFIFKRIFNWRLMSLSSGTISAAYILEQHNELLPTSGPDKLELEGTASSLRFMNYPSLDEMVEAGCIPLSSGTQPQLEASQPQSAVIQIDKCPYPTSTRDLDETNFAENGERTMPNDVASLTTVSVVATKVTGEAENLSKLLQHCNMLQNIIDEKLSIYF